MRVRGSYTRLNKLKAARLLLKDNGLQWSTYFLASYVLENTIDLLHNRMRALERCHNLPGSNSVGLNYEKWQSWDWSKLGEEWTPSAEWKESVIRDVLEKYLAPDGTILEIGPGGGRWAEPLQRIAAKLIVVDLSDKCIEVCKSRFAHCANIEYFVTRGSELHFIESSTIDAIWSFDVFVHLSLQDTESYLSEIERVLQPGGRGVIHHPKDGGWRNRMTARLFADSVSRLGLVVKQQFDSWGTDGKFNLRHHGPHGAMITVFEK